MCLFRMRVWDIIYIYGYEEIIVKISFEEK